MWINILYFCLAFSLTWPDFWPELAGTNLKLGWRWGWSPANNRRSVIHSGLFNRSPSNGWSEITGWPHGLGGRGGREGEGENICIFVSLLSSVRYCYPSRQSDNFMLISTSCVPCCVPGPCQSALRTELMSGHQRNPDCYLGWLGWLGWLV